MDAPASHSLSLLERTSLPVAEAAITADALLAGAAAGLSLVQPYCNYLVSTLMDAVTTAQAADESLDQPQLNKYTVFADTWHATSLARLSDADIANGWRLADYLMLDAACFLCLEDVAVQRLLRTGITNPFLSLSPSAMDNVTNRSKEIRRFLGDIGSRHRSLVCGLVLPIDRSEMYTMAQWGHGDLILQAREAGMQWDCWTIALAASTGHFRVVQRLRQAGCPWDGMVVESACRAKEETFAIWALDNGARTFVDWLDTAAEYGCLAVLQWAWNHGRLPAGELSTLREVAHSEGHAAIVSWLPARGRRYQ
jgi:hypothetical protein